MARATESDVLEIIDTDLDEEQVAPFLTAANVLVTQVLGSTTIGSDLLREIERWLAAHFVAVRDPRTSRERIGEAEAVYEGKTDLGLNHTRYGQQVMVLDVTGKFASLTSGKGPATLEAVG